MTKPSTFSLPLPVLPAAAPRRPTATIVHGVELADDYAWLRAANWRDVLRDPDALPGEIKAVLDAENAYADAVMAPTKALQKRLVAEMRGRMEEDEADVPVPDGPYEYYWRYREGGEHELLCRQPRGGGPEALLLDGDALAESETFFEFGDAQHAPDHRRLAWSADLKGSELHTIRVRDLASGEDLPDAVPDAEGTAVWTADAAAFFYVKVDENHRACRVFLHRLGTPAAQDKLILHEPDPGWFVSIGRTRSGRFAIIAIHGHDASEAHVIDLAAPEAPPRLIAPRSPGLRYEVDHRGEDFILLTNAGDAIDFKIVTAPVTAPGHENWTDLVAHAPGRMIVAAEAFRDHLVRLERENGLPQIVIRRFADAQESRIAFPEEAYALGLEEVDEQDVAVMRFSYSSMTTPEEIYDYDMETGERLLRKRQKIPSGHDPAAYVTRRLFATSPDGASVPISVLHAKDLPLDGTSPLLLYAYGAYGHSIPASFGTKRLSLVDRGFVYAIAHVRGGTDKGWAWYTDGKLLNKPHTFDDFLSAAKALVAAGFTAEGRIVAQGASAGGMPMGVCANVAPELFAAILADVPFVDVLTTMLDEELPLTPPEWLEWGNPGADKAAFDTILSYSPYDNVRPQAYPAILALGGLTDPRVTYWEPAKWVAKLRACATGGGPILLKTNMDAGHGGASGRFEALEEVALQFAFALAAVGRLETSSLPVRRNKR